MWEKKFATWLKLYFYFFFPASRASRREVPLPWNAVSVPCFFFWNQISTFFLKIVMKSDKKRPPLWSLVSPREQCHSQSKTFQEANARPLGLFFRPPFLETRYRGYHVKNKVLSSSFEPIFISRVFHTCKTTCLFLKAVLHPLWRPWSPLTRWRHTCQSTLSADWPIHIQNWIPLILGHGGVETHSIALGRLFWLFVSHRGCKIHLLIDSETLDFQVNTSGKKYISQKESKYIPPSLFLLWKCLFPRA